MRFDRIVPSLIGLAVLLLASACQDGEEERPAPEEPRSTLTVWHSWGQGAPSALAPAIESYEQESGGRVELVAFESADRLRQDLETADNPPDVFFGPHLWARDLLDQGVVSAYCTPDTCEECRGANPPDWCPYALGRFGDLLIERFGGQTALCPRGTCPACFGQNPPIWCRYARGETDARIDLPRAAFATWIDGDVFPIGIPVWWEYLAVSADRTWFEERAVEVPQNVADLRTVIEEHPDAVRVTDPVLDGHPVPFPADVGRLQGDPSPQPNAPGLVIGSSRELLQGLEGVEQPMVLSLEGYPPPVLFHGAYLRNGTELRSEALEFMYDLVYPEVQQQIFERLGGLPANGRTLEEVEEQASPGTVGAGTSGLPLGAGRLEQDELGEGTASRVGD